MLTDIHVHLAALPTPDNGVIVSPRMLRGPVARGVARHLGLPLDRPEAANRLYLEKLRGELDASEQVGRVVLLAMDGTYDAAGRLDAPATDFLIPNDLVFAAAAEDARLLPGVSINPARRDAVEEAERCAARGAVLVKVLPNAQAFDPAEPRFLLFYRALARLGLPLLSHVGHEYSIVGKDQDAGDPRRLLAPLEAGLTVIAAHACSEGRFFREPHLETMLSLVRRYPRFYCDLSALTLPNRFGMLLRLRRFPEIHGRLLFGTDFPLPVFAYPLLAAGDIGGWRRARAARSRFDRQAIVLDALGLTPSLDFLDILKR